MIIVNGKLKTISKSGGSSVGRLEAVQYSESAPIGCNISVSSRSKSAQGVDSWVTASSLVVLIDACAACNFQYERVHLFDNRGNDLGKFRVQDAQHCDFTDAIRLVVTRENNA